MRKKKLAAIHIFQLPMSVSSSLQHHLQTQHSSRTFLLKIELIKSFFCTEKRQQKAALPLESHFSSCQCFYSYFKTEASFSINFCIKQVIKGCVIFLLKGGRSLNAEFTKIQPLPPFSRKSVQFSIM